MKKFIYTLLFTTVSTKGVCTCAHPRSRALPYVSQRGRKSSRQRSVLHAGLRPGRRSSVSRLMVEKSIGCLHRSWDVQLPRWLQWIYLDLDALGWPGENLFHRRMGHIRGNSNYVWAKNGPNHLPTNHHRNFWSLRYGLHAGFLGWFCCL